jgi:hypothetical protein
MREMKTVTVYITAENPHYNRLPLRMNNARMYQLLHDLRRLVPFDKIQAGQFFDIPSGYTEHCYRASGIRLEDAIQLARFYGQESIVVEGLGLLNVNTLQYNPIKRKWVGAAALKRPMYTVLEGRAAVSFEFDTTKQLRL